MAYILFIIQLYWLGFQQYIITKGKEYGILLFPVSEGGKNQEIIFIRKSQEALSIISNIKDVQISSIKLQRRLLNSDRFGSKILTWVGSVFGVLGGSGQPYLWFGVGKFPLKIPNFSIFFPSDQKNHIGLGQKVPGSKTGQPLTYCGPKVCSGWVRAISLL